MQNNRIELKAYGKINLYLDVVGRRKDGLHYIYSVMQGIGIADEINFERIENPTNNYCFIKDVALEFCTKDSTIPCNEDNLAVKGAGKVLEKFEEKAPGICKKIFKEPIRCEIIKRIPVAAGLAGGSADAAISMIGLNELAGCPLNLEELMAAGIEVGSDVPFSIMMNAAMNKESLEVKGDRSSAGIVCGVGENVEPAMPLKKHVVLINPGVPISTKAVYEEIDKRFELKCEYGADEEYNKKMDFYNLMEECTIQLSRETAMLRNWMLDNMKADIVLMSGSGPTMVAYYDDEEQADKGAALACKEAKKRKGWRVFKTVSGGR